MEDSRIELLAQVASLYYEHNFSQEEIATRTGYSRSMISRLLKEARDKNVVEVRINYPLERCLDIEEALQMALNLRIVRVLQRGVLGQTEMLRRLGAMAARLVEELVDQGIKRIGISWGTALYETTTSMRKRNYTDTRVYQIVGASGSLTPEADGPTLARNLAEALGGQYFTLPAPLIVENPATREALLHDPNVIHILREAGSFELALVGIGSLDAQTSSLIRSGYLSKENADALLREGIIGDVCGIMFDKDGNIRDADIRQRVIGISPEDLKKIPIKLGISAGESKTLPILGACRAGLVNSLVTDEVAALGVLEAFRNELAGI
ncbi:MAG: sugar-binding transcriptional regulator [Anaerolineales bacterium]